MEVKKATYIISSPTIEDCPEGNLPEIAFIGRSNVGKSSLINMLSNKQALAKVSGNPGKTQMINHFNINDMMYWVDLPGYGFAKVSLAKRKSWEKMIQNYLTQRKNLCTVFVLIDVSISTQKIDLEFINQLGSWGVPLNIIFTKADRETQNVVSKHVRVFCAKLLENWEAMPDYFVTSKVKRTGRDKILGFIGNLADIYIKEHGARKIQE
jgi:GTP-binding protein